MNGTSAVGGFGVLVPLTTLDSTCKMPKFLILRKCQLLPNTTANICTYSLNHVPFGVFNVYFHDIEQNGLLNSPISLPATSLLKTVLGLCMRLIYFNFVYHFTTETGTYRKNIKSNWCEVVDGGEGVDVHTDSNTNVLSISCSSDCMTVLQSVENPGILWINSTSVPLGSTLTINIKEKSSYYLNVFILGPDGLLSSNLAYSNMVNNYGNVESYKLM